MPDGEIENRARHEANHLFSSAGAAVQGLRLRVEKKVVVSLEDLYAAFQEARRKFEDRKYREAYDKYDQVYNQFGERIGQWERKAEGHLQAVKNSHKPGKLEQLKTEIADVKKQSQSVLRLLSRLRSALEPLSKLEDAIEAKTASPGFPEPGLAKRARTPERRRTVRPARVVDESLLEFPDDEGTASKPGAEAGPPPQAAWRPSARVPRGFLDAFRTASPDRRPEMIEQHFDFESEIAVEMAQTAERRMTVAFDPALEAGRFYFLLEAARIIRIDAAGKVLEIYDPVEDRNETMPLKDFVRHVQGGAWLLRPKPEEKAV
jgi:hypothetical protein